MMDQWQKLAETLEKHEIEYERAETKDGAPYIVVEYDIRNGSTLRAFLDFSEDHTVLDITVMNIASVDEEETEKRGKLLELLNEMNATYRFGTFFLDADGDVTCMYNFVAEDTLPDEDLPRVLGAMFHSIEEEYKRFVQIVWA